jgi:hypothetical protein
VKKHAFRWLATSGLIALAASLALVLPSQAATSSNFVHAGNAWGSKAQVGGLVISTPSVAVDIGSCFTQTGGSVHKTAQSLSIPNILTSATVDSRVETGHSTNSTFTRSTETIQNLNMLGGAITATSLKALSEVRYTDGSGFSFKNGSTVTSLTINGQTINSLPPNARIDLPGIGFVVVNEQTRTVKTNFASQEVNLLHVHVTNAGNPLGLQLGTDITVGHAYAGLSTPLPIGGRVNGTSGGVFYQEGNVVRVGPSPHSSIPCLGGSNSATLASQSVPNILSTATLTTTAKGTLGATKTVGHTTSTAETVNVLSGLVKATGVKAVAHAEFNGTTYSSNSNGSTFLSLIVNGVPVNPTMNTVIQIQNVGTLYLYRVIKGAKSITVRMIELVLNPGNNRGLPAGTTIRVGMANVSFP